MKTLKSIKDFVESGKKISTSQLKIISGGWTHTWTEVTCRNNSIEDRATMKQNYATPGTSQPIGVPVCIKQWDL